MSKEVQRNKNGTIKPRISLFNSLCIISTESKNSPGFFFKSESEEKTTKYLLINSCIIDQSMIDNNSIITLKYKKFEVEKKIKLNKDDKKIYIFPEDEENVAVLEIKEEDNISEPEILFLRINPLYSTKGPLSYDNVLVFTHHFSNKYDKKLNEIKFDDLEESIARGIITEIEEFITKYMDCNLTYIMDLVTDFGPESIITFLVDYNSNLIAFEKISESYKKVYGVKQCLFIGKILKIINEKQMNLYPNKSKLFQFIKKENMMKRFGNIYIRTEENKLIVYKGEIKAHYYEGEGELTVKDGIYYKGYFSKSQFYGKGILKTKENYSFEGTWKNGILEGEGKVICPDGKVLKGNFYDSIFDGEGTVVYGNESKYELKFDKNKKKLVGTLTNPDGTNYIGEFEKGKRHGYGKGTYPNGDHYEGDYVYNKFEGKGIFTTKDGFCYEGEFKDNEFHGQGKCTSPMGDNCEGKFIDGCFTEEGTLNMRNGGKYEAKWDKDKKHLYGSVTFPKWKYIGELKNGDFFGFGVSTYFTGEILKYVGEFENNKYNGFGIIYFKDGIKICGIWDHDSNPKLGIIYASNGIYKGEMEDLLGNGYGIFYKNDGSIKEGYFENEKLGGYGIYINIKKGIKYEGEFINGGFNNIGTLTQYKEIPKDVDIKNQKKLNEIFSLNNIKFQYEGEFLYGEFDGFGIYINEKGEKYEGQWKYGTIDGFGTYHYQDGSIYTGEFKKGHPSGNGTWIYPNGKKPNDLSKDVDNLKK